MTTSLAPPAVEIGPAVLRMATPDDTPTVGRLSGLPVNRDAHGLDLLSVEHGQGLLAAVGAGMWSTPMVAVAGGEPIAFLALANVDPRDLNAGLVALFAGSAVGTAGSAVRRYVELLFWAYPLQRIECRAIRPGGGYRTVLLAGGLTAEGTVRRLALRGGHRLDVEYLSVIRDDLVGEEHP